MGIVPDAPFKPVTELRIENNNLNGSLPNELVHLLKLETLVLSGNNLKGVEAFGVGLDSLTSVVLSDNPLQNHKDLFRLTNLETLYLERTEFSGTLPADIQQLSNMRYLRLSGNNLGGRLTNRFQTMSRLEHLLLDHNQFEGTIDEILKCGNCTSTLTDFTLRQNPLSGN